MTPLWAATALHHRLSGVDVWLESHVRTAILYVRWDDKAGTGRPAELEGRPKTLVQR
jgi:hypothetical protein